MYVDKTLCKRKMKHFNYTNIYAQMGTQKFKALN
jgi:hypothetical protein